MSITRQLIKAAVDGLSAEFDKIAVVPVEGGQIPPPQGAMMPPPPPGASPAMMDPSAGGGMPPGMPPMDPSMMGPPPGAGGPPGGMPPMDPSMMGPPPGPDAGAPPAPPADAGGSPSDPAVPLSAIANFTTAIIEATKGKRTADPKDPNAAGDPAAQDPAAAGGLPSAIANLGGAPSDTPAPLPGMAPTGGPPKAARALDTILDGIRQSRGYRR